MIITRTPFRISFFGGGTDYPVYYKEHGGAVLSTTINKYCYINCRYLPPFFDYKYRIRYTMREETKNVSEIEHPSVRECLKFVNAGKGIEMVHTSDIPARSGIGSSSSFTVGFLNALYALSGKMVTKRQLAREAIHIEQSIIKENVGSQDQVAAAFGGINKIEFGGDREFYVTPMTIKENKLKMLQDSLMFFYTGIVRNASEIASEQINATPSKKKELDLMVEIVDEAVNILNADSDDIDDFGSLLHKSWKIKRSITNLITNGKIDQIYDTALKAGALGGKLLGAGGGGFFLFFVHPEMQEKVKAELRELLHVPFRFEDLGSQVIMYSTQDFY
jgi:D-glycero-alpha-D-manno-heptose-7-phosphate kinase